MENAFTAYYKLVWWPNSTLNIYIYISNACTYSHAYIGVMKIKVSKWDIISSCIHMSCTTPHSRWRHSPQKYTVSHSSIVVGVHNRHKHKNPPHTQNYLELGKINCESNSIMRVPLSGLFSSKRKLIACKTACFWVCHCGALLYSETEYIGYMWVF